MKTWLLWLLVVLVLVQAYCALEIGPEFHILTHDEYLKQIQEYSNLPNPPQGIGTLETNEYFNGRNGRFLVNVTLIIDAVMLFLLVVAIMRTRQKKSLSPSATSSQPQN
jgi:hypothetical protein